MAFPGKCHCFQLEMFNTFLAPILRYVAIYYISVFQTNITNIFIWLSYQHLRPNRMVNFSLHYQVWSDLDMVGVSPNLGHYRLMTHFFIDAFDFTNR